MTLMDLSLLSIVITTGVAAFLLLFAARRSANYVFILLMSCFSVLSISEVFMRYSSSAFQALFWGRIAYSVGILAGCVVAHFSVVFPRRFFPEDHLLAVRRDSLVLLYALGVTVIVLFNSVISLKSVELKPWGFRIGITSETLFFIFWIVGCSLFAVAVFAVAYFRRPITVNERKQIIALTVGVLVLLFFRVWSNFLPPSLHDNMVWMSTFSFVFFTGIVTYALLWHRLFLPTPAETADIVLETMADALLVVNEKELIVQVNAATLSALGYQENELLERQLSSVLHNVETTDCALSLPPFVKLVSSGRMRDVEVTFKAKDGTAIPMNVSASHILHPRRGLEGTVIVARNLTETKHFIDELAAAKDSLGVAVEERTRELYTANLELQKEIASRKDVEMHLRQSLAEKELLLKEIHHRVKNNLQIISSILDMQADTLSESHVLDAFRESQNRVKSMALVHEQLYQSGDLAQIDFKEYVQNLMAYLQDSFGFDTQRIRLVTNINNVSLSIDESIPCGFIINELITNAFKHGFPGGRSGTISVDFSKQDDGMYILVVHDNGVGFPATIAFHATKTLGLQLVNILTSQLHGTIELNRENGTSFTLRFPGIKSNIP